MRPRNYVIVLVALFVFLSFLSLLGICAEKEITWFYSLSASTIDALKPLFTRLERDTGIKVKIEPVDYNFMFDKLQLRVAGGIAPEWIDFGTEFAPIAAQGIMQPLDQYIKDDCYDLSQFDPAMVESMRLWGRQWEIPHSAVTMTLQYNCELFDEAGLTYPSHNWDDRSWNWEAFINVAKKLTKRDSSGRYTQFGIGSMQTSWVYPWYFGGDWVSKDLTRYTGNSPETIRAIEAIADLILKHHVMPTEAERSQLAPGIDPFFVGKIGMRVDGIWGIQDLVRGKTAVDFRWDLAATPFGTHHSVVAFVDGFAISRGSKNPKLAWEVFKWLNSREHHLDWLEGFRAGMAIPARRDVQQEWVNRLRKQYPKVDPQVIVDALKYAQPVRMRYLTNWKEIDAAIAAALGAVWSGSKSPSTALNEIASRVQALIDKGRVEPKI